ncbi:MAG: hypothetical protein WBG70_16905 [Spirulinaceae cyanobacterium]
MNKRRARLNDENNPLSSTDEVLAGFEQFSKSASQLDNNLESQEADQLANQEDKLPISQKDEKPSLTPDESATEIAKNKKKSRSKKANNLTRKQANFSTSQQVKSQTTKLRKSTFQIDENVLRQLEKLHLTLQMELGKANAPYKEVIVEEALVQLLEEADSDDGDFIDALLKRQKKRDKNSS